MKRLIITMISAALLSLQLGGCSFDYSSSESRESSAEVSYSSDDVYETIASALSEYESLTHYSAKLSQDTIDEAVRKLQHFHPEYFWLNGYTTTSTSDSTVIDFMTLNDYSSDELRTMHTELITAADSVISQIPAGSSDYDKALFVHDYIVSSTAYATEKRGLNYNGLWGNAYGCLVDGSAVCQGYAEAFSLIMQRLGIECGVCTGQSDRGSHAWNYVKIDGAYYWVDATWDDPEAEGDGGSKLRHNYFMIDDELLLRTRTLGDTQYFVPRCSTMDRNYFVMKNAYLRGYFPEEVGRVLAENADTGIAEIMFADEASFRSAVDGLFEGQEIWDLSGYAELGYTLSYSYDDKMYVLQINY
ncbi:MAG: transglutaminase domain-containing protein [Ruminococcus sp.]|nr:transglutaminase domain-containing protein [Ruminococcus sp.]